MFLYTQCQVGGTVIVGQYQNSWALDIKFMLQGDSNLVCQLSEALTLV